MTDSGAPIAQLIDHVAVVTADADRTVLWYEANLGLVRAHDERVDDAGVRLVWMRPAEGASPDATALQIVEPYRDGPVATHLAQQGEGLHHICFSVSRLPDALARLDEPSSSVFRGGYGLPCAFLSATPEGTPIELVERAPSNAPVAPRPESESVPR